MSADLLYKCNESIFYHIGFSQWDEMTNTFINICATQVSLYRLRTIKDGLQKYVKEHTSRRLIEMTVIEYVV